MEFSNKDLILITGASSGIGKTIALKLNTLGVRVIAVARREEKLKELVLEAKYPENIFYYVKDLNSEFNSIGSMIKELVEKYGKISGFIHSVGVFNMQPLKIFDIDQAISDFKTNYFSAIEIIKHLSNKKNRQDLMSIVLISSTAAIAPNSGNLIYAATKASICCSVRNLTKEIGKNHIRINSIMPGLTATDMSINNNALNYNDNAIAATPFKEIGKPEYIADLAVFLLSRQSYWIQGQNIAIDGGAL